MTVNLAFDELHAIMDGSCEARLNRLIEQAQSAEPAQSCRWVRDEDNDTYITKCGSAWHYSDGGYPEEHGQFYCHHCGKQIDEEGDNDE